MKTLFDETRINGMVLKNRLIRSAIWENMADEEGRPAKKLLEFYRETARGGVGTIITGCTFVMPDDQFYPGMMGMWDDSLIEDYKDLTSIVHSYGCNIVQQLACGGPQGLSDLMWGPSDVADLATGKVPDPMSREDINKLVVGFAKAAGRAKAAGFNGVEIHGAHGYLLSQFLSPYYNRRSDEYGGSVENRARIFVEVYDAIREAVGTDFSIWLKINSADYIENGATFEDCKYVCTVLAERGLDAVEVSGGTLASKDFVTAPGINKTEKEAYHTEAASGIAASIEIPVILVGGLRSPSVMEEILRTTPIDYFALGRPLLAEPNLPVRWQSSENRSAACVSCNRCVTEDGEGNRCIHKKRWRN